MNQPDLQCISNILFHIAVCVRVGGCLRIVFILLCISSGVTLRENEFAN